MPTKRILAAAVLVVSLFGGVSIGVGQTSSTNAIPADFPELPAAIAELGPPEVFVKKSDTLEIFGEPDCGGFTMRIEIARSDIAIRRWHSDESTIGYGLAFFDEDVVLTNMAGGKAVTLRLAYTQVYDGINSEWTMWGLRSGVVQSDESVLPVNYGRIVVTGENGWVRGPVKESEGRWDAVYDGHYDHI